MLIGGNASLRIDLSFSRCGVSSTAIIPAAVRAGGAALRLLLVPSLLYEYCIWRRSAYPCHLNSSRHDLLLLRDLGFRV